jgi:CubicO group peptidase (beta-lactamase class C family)
MTLGARVRELLGNRHRVVAAAVVTPAATSVASLGAPPDADFEIGSVSKGITGLLYVDALARGEIAPTTTLGDLLPLGTAPAAAVTLASISTHRSGLPRLPPSFGVARRTLALWSRGTNPYGERVDQLLEQAREVKLGKPRPRYSNLGYELLGHAIARAAGMSYADLFRQRIAEPLELNGSYLPATPDELRPTALRGTSRSGRPREPWTGEAIGPAGGIRAPIGDLARLTAALLAGTAPGITALDPVTTLGGRGVRIGAAWITMHYKERTITWHNGGTGGFRSWLGLDRAAASGAAIVTACERSVDRAGFNLLDQLTPRPPRKPRPAPQPHPEPP